MRAILTKRLTSQRLHRLDFADQARDFHRDMSAWLADGRVRYREDVVDGLENAPAAFMGLLKGRNFGKLVVKLSEPPWSA